METLNEDLRTRAPATAGADARRRYRAVAIGLAASDALCLAAALLISYAVRFGLVRMPLDFAVVMLVAPLVWLLVFHGFKLYAPWRLSPPEEFRRILGAASVGIVLLVLGSFWSRTSFPREWVGLTWLLVLVFELTARRLWRWYLGRLKLDGRLAFRTLVVGANEEAERLTENLGAPGAGFRPIGLVATDDREGERQRRLPVLGPVSELRGLIDRHGADCVFVASTAIPGHDLGGVAKAARRAGAEVWISANLPQLLATRLSVQPVGRGMAVSISHVRLTGAQALFKRAFDVALAAALLVLTAPLWLVVAALVKLSSPGRVLFRQVRAGYRGRPFTMLKFRSMVDRADAMRHSLEARNEAPGPLFKMRRDPRVTRIGRWLRRWSVDELPQLLNVLRGQMSMVGPRPPLPEEVRRYEDWHHDRLEVRPGITGLWQVSRHTDYSFDEVVRLDIFYIENWSLAYDLFILARTIPVILRGSGAA